MSQETLIKVGKLIDGLGGAPAEDMSILIENKRIKKISPQSAMVEHPECEVIDAAHLTALPGLMDAHLHICLFNNVTFKNYRVAMFEVTPELQQMYMLFHAQLCLEHGFTTLRDVGATSSRGLMTSAAVAVRDAIEAGIFGGPRLICAAWTIGTGMHLDLCLPRAAARDPDSTADGPEEMRKLARRNLLKGADWLKTCASGGGGTDKEAPDVLNHTQEELNVIAYEAHAQHKYMATHCFTAEAHRMALAAGTDTIEHMVFCDEDSVERIVQAGVPVTPTLLHRTDRAIDIRRETGTPLFTLEKMKKIQPHCFETFQIMHKAGVKIAMGTDMGFEPDMGTNAGELSLYVDLGMTPMEAIQTATKNAAEALHLAADIGTLEAGKYADLVLVNGDPSQDIRLLEDSANVMLVMKEGLRLVDRRPGHETHVVPGKPKSWKIIDA